MRRLIAFILFVTVNCSKTEETDKRVAISPEVGPTSVVGSEPEGQNTETVSPLSEPKLLGDLSTPSDLPSVISAREQCENQGEIWQDEKCKTQTQIDCEKQAGLWLNGKCVTSETKCTDGGGVWAGTVCITKAQNDCQLAGNVWQSGQCKTQVQQVQVDCENQEWIWQTSVCKSPDQVSCENAGTIWLDDTCVSLNQANCEAAEKIWTEETCKSLAQIDCEKLDQRWDAEVCKTQAWFYCNQELDKEGKPKVWLDPDCKPEAQIACDALADQGHLWNPTSQSCMSPSEACGPTWDEGSSSCLTPELYCTQVKENIWQFGSCKTLVEAQEECSTLSGVWLGNERRCVISGSQAFVYTNAPQPFVVPEGVDSVKILARGGKGGKVGCTGTVDGGKGASVRSSFLTVTPGESLYVYVGGAAPNISCNAKTTSFGYNGGAPPGLVNNHNAAGGGGASDVRRGGSTLENRVIVAAGGGGGVVYSMAPTAFGHGGCMNGTTGGGGCGVPESTANKGGTGGTQNTGGISGVIANGTRGDNGTLGMGGKGADATTTGIGSGGGGGGYYGGGGGGNCPLLGYYRNAEGGGGSSFIEFASNPLLNNASYCIGGHNNGHGSVTICWGQNLDCDTL